MANTPFPFRNTTNAPVFVLKTTQFRSENSQNTASRRGSVTHRVRLAPGRFGFYPYICSLEQSPRIAQDGHGRGFLRGTKGFVRAPGGTALPEQAAKASSPWLPGMAEGCSFIK